MRFKNGSNLLFEQHDLLLIHDMEYFVVDAPFWDSTQPLIISSHSICMQMTAVSTVRQHVGHRALFYSLIPTYYLKFSLPSCASQYRHSNIFHFGITVNFQQHYPMWMHIYKAASDIYPVVNIWCFSWLSG